MCSTEYITSAIFQKILSCFKQTSYSHMYHTFVHMFQNFGYIIQIYIIQFSLKISQLFYLFIQIFFKKKIQISQLIKNCLIDERRLTTQTKVVAQTDDVVTKILQQEDDTIRKTSKKKKTLRVLVIFELGLFR